MWFILYLYIYFCVDVYRCVLLLERSSPRVSAQVWYHHHGWTSRHVLGPERYPDPTLPLTHNYKQDLQHQQRQYERISHYHLMSAVFRIFVSLWISFIFRSSNKMKCEKVCKVTGFAVFETGLYSSLWLDARPPFQENGCSTGLDECGRLSMLPGPGRGCGEGNTVFER